MHQILQSRHGLQIVEPLLPHIHLIQHSIDMSLIEQIRRGSSQVGDKLAELLLQHITHVQDLGKDVADWVGDAVVVRIEQDSRPGAELLVEIILDLGVDGAEFGQAAVEVAGQLGEVVDASVELVLNGSGGVVEYIVGVALGGLVDEVEIEVELLEGCRRMQPLGIIDEGIGLLAQMTCWLAHSMLDHV